MTSAATPLVSIVVPVFNGERYLRESLDSILAQRYPRTEVIVLDDASTDGTAAVVAGYGATVRCHRQPANVGIYGNANTGIAMARGELIAVYHADDVYEPTIVEREVEFLTRHPEAGAVFCLDVFIDQDGEEYDRLRIPPAVRGGRPLSFPVVLDALLTHMNTFLVCPTAMVPARVYRELGGYRDGLFRNSADLDMWVRIARRFPIGILEEHLLRYRHFHGSSSQRYHRLRTSPSRHFAIMDLHLREGARALASPAALRAHEAHRAEDFLMIAISHYVLGDLAAARAALRQARPARIVASRRVQRWRLLALRTLLDVLCRLPRSAAVAAACERRWHRPRRPHVSILSRWRALAW